LNHVLHSEKEGRRKYISKFSYLPNLLHWREMLLVELYLSHIHIYTSVYLSSLLKLAHLEQNEDSSG